MSAVTFVNQSGDALGGAEHSLELLLRALPADIRPSAVLFSNGTFERRLREIGIPVTVVDMPAQLMSTTRERPASSGLLDLPSSIGRVATALKASDPDLVYTNSVKAHIVGSAAARSAGKPAIAHVRDILDGMARLIVRTALLTCTVSRIAISRAVRDAYALSKTEVIPNPLELSLYDGLPERADARRSLGLSDSGRLVSLIGRINRWKGHDRFVRIARLVRDQNAHFAIVGSPVFRDANFLDELRRQVRGLGLDGRLSFIPWIDDPRVAYAASDVVCNCSYNEPFGRTLIEAAACGVPSVCFAGGGTADAVLDGETGLIVREGPDDEDRFARAVKRLLDDEQLRRRMAEGARQYARQFDAGLHAERVAAVIRRAL